MIAHVVAMDRNRVIGRQNKLPWHFPADLKYFKALTTGQTVVMGRKTFESIGRALPNRANFVLSRAGAGAAEADAPGVRFFTSLNDAIAAAETEHVFVIGGAEVFRQTFDQVDALYVTRIDAEYEGDVFYPQIPADFEEISRQELQRDPLLTAVRYQRVKR